MSDKFCTMQIPIESVGLVIGRKGCNISEIQKATNTMISINKSFVEDDCNAVVILGSTDDAIKAACHHIENLVLHSFEVNKIKNNNNEEMVFSTLAMSPTLGSSSPLCYYPPPPGLVLRSSPRLKVPLLNISNGKFWCNKEEKFERFLDLPHELIKLIIGFVPEEKKYGNALLNLRRTSKFVKENVEEVMKKSKVYADKPEIGFDYCHTDYNKIRIKKSYGDRGVDFFPDELLNFLQFVRLVEGKSLFLYSRNENHCMLNKIFQVLIKFAEKNGEQMLPAELIVTGSLLKISPSVVLDYLRVTPSLRKLHFQDCTVGSTFFSDEFMVVLPELEGFLINLNPKCRMRSPTLNFTFNGLLSAVNKHLQYIFLPYLNDVTSVSKFNSLLQKFFEMVDKSKSRQAAMLSIGQGTLGLESLRKDIFVVNTEKEKADRKLAYQVNSVMRADLRPIIYHSYDCKGSFVLNNHFERSDGFYTDEPCIHIGHPERFSVSGLIEACRRI